MLGDGKCRPISFYGDLDLDLHCEQDVRVTLTSVAVVPGLTFDIMHFNQMQERHDIILNRAGDSMLGGRVRFKKFRAGNFIQATRVPHDDASPQAPAMVAAMMRPGPPSSMNVNDLHISLGHTNDVIAHETRKQMGMKVTDTRGYCDGCGEEKAIRRAVPRKAKVKSGRPLQWIFIDSTGPYPPSRAPFVGEVPTWGGGSVMDTAAGAVAPAVATVTGSGVFPAASARGAEGSSTSAAVAASTVTGRGVFPAASARGAAGAPVSAVVAAASAAATATAAAAAAAIPPDGARETAAARGGVFPTPPVDRTTPRHDQHPETATT